MVLRCLVAALIAVGPSFATQDTDALERRKRTLAELRRLLPASPPWEEWLRTTGELPPDFDALPRVPGLPDPLLRSDGLSRVRERGEWPARREELLELFRRYVIGRSPPPPANVRARILSEREEPGATTREVVLEFGPGHRATLSLWLFIPKGQGPFPVFLTQHNHRSQALVAVSRGYIGCVYAGHDVKDDTDSFAEIWPEYDWTRLSRRAWAASRCIDYLETLPVVDPLKIGMTGGSRNGKQSLIAAALDPRIASVVLSNAGGGGALGFRHWNESQDGEGIERLTRVFPTWFHPRLRFFSGREDRLPVDQHELVALVAPRPCLIATAFNDKFDSTWATQQSYRAAKPVYDLLGAEDRLRVAWRTGAHETRATDVETYLDWFDRSFGRGTVAFPETFPHPRFEDWAKGGERIDAEAFPERSLNDLPVSEESGWKKSGEELRKRIRWSLGEEPPGASNPALLADLNKFGVLHPYWQALLNRTSQMSFNFGEHIHADLYYPEKEKGMGRKLPAAIWLHPQSTSNGHVQAIFDGRQVPPTLADQGFVVLAFDGIGHGSRIEEGTRFYDRHPRWSLLGKMVRDVRAAVDILQRLPFVDPDRIYFVGYGLGARVGLHAAALDDRLAGGIALAGFTSLRLDTADRGMGGVARVSHAPALQPRLGAFIGHEARIPYDFHEVVALIAPRPLLIVAPRLDREHALEDVRRCFIEARKAYALFGAGDRLSLEVPDDFNRFTPAVQRNVYQALKAMAGGF